MPISNSDLLKIIEHFVPGDPLSYKLHDDGSLVVIADSGKKFTFSADQVESVHNFMKPDLRVASGRKVPSSGTRGMPTAGADGQPTRRTTTPKPPTTSPKPRFTT